MVEPEPQGAQEATGARGKRTVVVYIFGCPRPPPFGGSDWLSRQRRQMEDTARAGYGVAKLKILSMTADPRYIAERSVVIEAEAGIPNSERDCGDSQGNSATGFPQW